MLPDSERFKLLDGPYRMPKCKVGGWLNCRLRGRVKVVGISDGLIQWPVVVHRLGGGRGLALMGDLVKAAGRESGQAVAHWWGVSAQTVSLWRKTLGIDQNNRGTLRLRSKWWKEGGTGYAAKPGREATFHSAERAAKISAAKRGVPRPSHEAKRLRTAFKGRTHTEEARQKMSEAARSRGAYPPAAGRPFTPEEDALLGTMTDKEVAQVTGRHVMSIAQRRIRLGIESFRKRTRGW